MRRRPIRNGWWRSATAPAGCGVFGESYATVGSVEQVVPVDLHIKGCPPRPVDLLKGLIALMDKATKKPA